MTTTQSEELAQLPEEIMFSITKASSGYRARVGTLKALDKPAIETPHFLAVTSRGVVPHLSQDTFARQTDISGVYTALEDCRFCHTLHHCSIWLTRAHTRLPDVEKAPQSIPPLYTFKPSDGSSPLRRFIALPNDNLLVLGARRTPPVAPPVGKAASTMPLLNTSLVIMTSFGFRRISTKDYRDETLMLQPDIVVGLGDIPYGADKVSRKKIDKITDRTSRWMQEHVAARRDARKAGQAYPALFAPLLPLPIEAQKWYTDQLVEEMRDGIQGIAVYDTCALEHLPVELDPLPRLSFTEPKNPHIVLREVEHGVDVLTLPFIGAATDAGIALDFSFPPPSSSAPAEGLHPLGIDMWSPAHSTDLSPLRKECACYACTNHHRAYLQHLLHAKEMLGWVLLQIHNHHVISTFFAGIRASVSNDTFSSDVEAFSAYYEPELPAKTGQGPRSVRSSQLAVRRCGQWKS